MFSWIDDIVLPSELAHLCNPCHTPELGSLSDHVPLVISIPANILKIQIPIFSTPAPPKECPQKVLNRP
eukprot:314732-Pelagomonas_calceolata.AAC.1